MTSEQVLELAVPAKPEFVSLVRLIVAAVASGRRDLDDDRVADLKLAVSEACTNAIEAQATGSRAEGVIVRCIEMPDRFEVRVDDQGGGFDPAAIEPPPAATDPDRLDFERGLGIPLIRALVDEVEFRPAEGGTSVRMVVFCPPVPTLEWARADLGDDADLDESPGPLADGGGGPA